MKQNFFDHLDGGWGDLIADTYKESNTFKPPYKKSTYNNETLIALAEIYDKNPELVENKELYFENGLEYIPGYSFYNTNITGDLIFPNSLKQIGMCAFANCKKLKGDLIFPNFLKQIGMLAFANCTGFKGSLELHSVKNIENAAFMNNVNLTSIHLQDGIKKIGHRAFFNCTSLSGELQIPESVDIIGSEAFIKCNFSKIYVPSHFKSDSDWNSGCNAEIVYY